MTTTQNYIDPDYLNFLQEEWHASDPYLAALVAQTRAPVPPAPEARRAVQLAAVQEDERGVGDHERR